ncbi:hypothetical protein [Tardiphaga sp.]|jgi:hypothetical protein|uniref:hypothetical protein n=1 Tax=Tardiphaga sp. TaxID=1926292 RepID=UPI0037D9AD5A
MPRLSLLPNAASHPTSDIDAASFTAICLASCKRLPTMRRNAEAKRLDNLVAAGAWTDAALTLIAIELPDWQLRRLAFDEGEWHCALSSERNMPDWLDDAVETHHADMATAILDAFRSAIARRGTPHLTAVPAIASLRTDFTPMLCENYC